MKPLFFSPGFIPVRFYSYLKEGFHCLITLTNFMGFFLEVVDAVTKHLKNLALCLYKFCQPDMYR